MRVDNDDQVEETPLDRKRRMARDRKRKQRDGDGPRAARKWNPDACPPGWDGTIWHLTLFFEQVGLGYGHKSNGRPIIYGYLEKRINETGIRNFLGEPLPDREAADQPWVRLVQRMIRYFWDYDMNPSQPSMAINDFASPIYFADQRDYIIGRVIAAADKEDQVRLKARGETTCACHARPAHENHKRIS